MSIDVSVIIVNYNTRELLAKCLESLFIQDAGLTGFIDGTGRGNHDYESITFEVIVADNASTDGSQEIFSEEFKWAQLISCSGNLGFSKANNLGVAASKGRYIYFLNPDTEVSQGAITAIVKHMDANPECGLAGTRIINPDGSPQSSVEFSYPGQRHTGGELENLPGDIAWLLGASIVAQRSVVEALKGFDEDYFLYGEDLDLCLRARKAGFEIGMVGGNNDAVIIHHGGQSEVATLPYDKWVKKLNAELLFYEKHYEQASIARIIRNNLLQARWRIFTIKLLLPFKSARQNDLAKLEKYLAVRDVFGKAATS